MQNSKFFKHKYRSRGAVFQWRDLGKQKKEDNFPRLAKAFLIRVAESNRNFYIVSREVPSAATPPRALRWEPRRENRMTRTIVSRVIEGVKINSIRWDMWDIYSPCLLIKGSPSTPPKNTCIYHHPACQLGGNCATPLPSDSPCLVWRGRVLFVTIRATRCGSSNNS